ncbi:MAG: hypothetical protein J07HQW1_02336 [Haloquadratum walsbyi J07HQW1]|uniref:Uncharacterized protein n=1 Tax=Haloquadratum walsbyi J07HQW1 TaxID=1238424 RepID=U1N6L6_9EURY|nr:MAG: hypothetical protein J07HQW1_02336 [Haloquadratum walsbyi J07HQW1]
MSRIGDMTHTRPNLLRGKGAKAFILDCGSEPIYSLVVTFADGTISIVMILLWDTEISSIFMPVLSRMATSKPQSMIDMHRICGCRLYLEMRAHPFNSNLY